MPNVIITPAFAAIRARAKSDQYNYLAQGVQDTANIVAQSLLVYSQRRDQEDKEKLAILDHMTSTYGDKVGQSALDEMDKILKRKGVGGLPKDPNTGKLMPPPPSLEAMMSSEVRNNPELLHSAVQKKLTGISPIEASFKQQELERRRQHDQIMEDVGRLNADAHMISAKASLARASKGDEFSGLLQMPDGSIKTTQEATDPETGQVPPGSVALMGKQADKALKLMAVRNAEQVKAKDQELKQSRLDLDHKKAADFFAYRAGTALWQMAKVYGAKTTTDKQREILRPKLEQGLKDAGVAEENIPSFFEGPPPTGIRGAISAAYGYFASFFNPKEHQSIIQQIEQDQMMKGALAPPIPGAIRLKSGKTLQEEVVPDEAP